jgi:integrase
LSVKRITQSLIRALTPPPTGNSIVWDSDVAGFGARITSAGAVAFVLNYTLNSRERRYTIGKYRDWSPAAAREEAIKLRGDVSRGEDPLADREGRRAAPTMGELCDQYMERHARPHQRPSSIEGDRLAIDRVIKPKLGSRRVAGVTHNDIDELHQTLRETPYRANRILALLSKMFSLASLKWQYRADNPCRGIQRFQEERRERYLKPEELQRLLQVLSAHPNQHSANAVRLLLMTGSRRGEVLSAKWDHIDLERGVWTKPSAHTKQKREHHIPLSAPVQALLSAMKSRRDGERDKSAFLFPSPAGDTPQRELKRFWRTVCRDVGLAGVRVHDLRRSFAAYLASSGASLPLIGEMLGHTQPSTTHRYAHLLDDPKRKAADRVGAIISAAETGTEPAEVVRFPR